MVSRNEIENSSNCVSIESNKVDTEHLSKEINWRFATELGPLPEYKFSHNFDLFENKNVEVGPMKLMMSCSADKKGTSEVEKFVSSNNNTAVTYQKLERSKQELEARLGRSLQPGEQAWSVQGGGIGKSNGFSDKEFIGKVTYDASKNAVIVDVSYPVKQQIVYNSDGSSAHQFANGVKTYTPAKHGGEDTDDGDAPVKNPHRIARGEQQITRGDAWSRAQPEGESSPFENRFSANGHQIFQRYAEHHRHIRDLYATAHDMNLRYELDDRYRFRNFPDNCFDGPPADHDRNDQRIHIGRSNIDLQINLEL